MWPLAYKVGGLSHYTAVAPNCLSLLVSEGERFDDSAFGHYN